LFSGYINVSVSLNLRDMDYRTAYLCYHGGSGGARLYKNWVGWITL